MVQRNYFKNISRNILNYLNIGIEHTMHYVVIYDTEFVFSIDLRMGVKMLCFIFFELMGNLVCE